MRGPVLTEGPSNAMLSGSWRRSPVSPLASIDALQRLEVQRTVTRTRSGPEPAGPWPGERPGIGSSGQPGPRPPGASARSASSWPAASRSIFRTQSSTGSSRTTSTPAGLAGCVAGFADGVVVHDALGVHQEAPLLEIAVEREEASRFGAEVGPISMPVHSEIEKCVALLNTRSPVIGRQSLRRGPLRPRRCRRPSRDRRR